MHSFASCALLIVGVSLVHGIEHQGRITDGSDAKRGQFPYQVAMTLKRQTVCGGVMVHKRFFLTAAHCFFQGETPLPVEQINVFYGSEKLFSNGRINRIKTVHMHEQFDHGTKYDLAVVEVRRSFEQSSASRPVAFGQGSFNESLPITVSGYGRNTAEGNMPFKLKYTQLTALSDEQCQEATGDDYYEGVFCLDTKAGAGLCMGDYGGPGVQENMLMGVGSFTTGGQCATGQPDVFVDVGFFSEWIRSKMEATPEDR